MSVVAKNSRVDQDATGTEVGRGPGYVVLHGDSAPPQRGIDAPPLFLDHIYSSQTARWIKMKLGMEVGSHYFHSHITNFPNFVL